MNERGELVALLVEAAYKYGGKKGLCTYMADHLINNGVKIPVRCAECKDARNEKALDNREYFMCKHTETCHSGNHFCSYGVKKDDAKYG